MLTDGTIQNENDDNINILSFKKTEINLSKFKTKSTTFPKIQEKNTLALLSCYNYFENKFDKFLTKDTAMQSCHPRMQEIRGEINKRFGNLDIEIWGDPAGDFRAQTDERTAFIVMRQHNIIAKPAEPEKLDINFSLFG